MEGTNLKARHILVEITAAFMAISAGTAMYETHRPCTLDHRKTPEPDVGQLSVQSQNDDGCMERICRTSV